MPSKSDFSDDDSSGGEEPGMLKPPAPVRPDRASREQKALEQEKMFNEITEALKEVRHSDALCITTSVHVVVLIMIARSDMFRWTVSGTQTCSF